MRTLVILVGLKVTGHGAAVAGAAMQEALLVGDDAVGRGAVRRRRHHEIEEVRLRQILAAASRREGLRQIHDAAHVVLSSYRPLLTPELIIGLFVGCALNDADVDPRWREFSSNAAPSTPLHSPPHPRIPQVT